MHRGMKTDIMSPDIETYNETHRQGLLSVWERSVLATHHFLDPEDFIAIKKLVHGMSFTELDVYCLMDAGKVIGFLGVAGPKIEMLFLDPDYTGQGLGKQLMNFAVTDLRASLVDVNEQNTNAVHFYKRSGFEVFGRTEKDGSGKGYPLLKMKLSSSVS